MKAVLAEAIEAGGSTLRDFVNASPVGRATFSSTTPTRPRWSACKRCGGLLKLHTPRRPGTVYCPTCQGKRPGGVAAMERSGPRHLFIEPRVTLDSTSPHRGYALLSLIDQSSGGFPFPAPTIGVSGVAAMERSGIEAFVHRAKVASIPRCCIEATKQPNGCAGLIATPAPPLLHQARMSSSSSPLTFGGFGGALRVALKDGAIGEQCVEFALLASIARCDRAVRPARASSLPS